MTYTDTTSPAQPPFGPDPPDYQGERYQPGQPPFQPPQKKGLPVWAKVVIVIACCATLLAAIGIVSGGSKTSAPIAPVATAPATAPPVPDAQPGCPGHQRPGACCYCPGERRQPASARRLHPRGHRKPQSDRQHLRRGSPVCRAGGRRHPG